MEIMKKIVFMIGVLIAFMSCKNQGKKNDVVTESRTIKLSINQIKEKLTSEGYQIFDYVDETSGDTVIMQQYFIAFADCRLS